VLGAKPASEESTNENDTMQDMFEDKHAWHCDDQIDVWQLIRQQQGAL
jgi:hypothetical protein